MSPAFGRVTQVRNAHGDRSFSFTTQFQKHLAGGKELSASYTYTAARDLLSATEDGLDANLDAVILDGTLDHRHLAPSAWGPSHRVTLMATTDLPLQFRMTLFYDGSSGSAFTYSVDGDANGDGYLSNDAIYVPMNAAPGGDIELVVENEQGDMVPAPASEYAELNHFIEEEGCLRKQRGHLLHRNSCRNPWEPPPMLDSPASSPRHTVDPSNSSWTCSTSCISSIRTGGWFTAWMLRPCCSWRATTPRPVAGSTADSNARPGR